jgi:hypothetical protein
MGKLQIDSAEAANLNQWTHEQLLERIRTLEKEKEESGVVQEGNFMEKLNSKNFLLTYINFFFIFHTTSQIIKKAVYQKHQIQRRKRKIFRHVNGKIVQKNLML